MSTTFNHTALQDDSIPRILVNNNTDKNDDDDEDKRVTKE